QVVGDEVREFLGLRFSGVDRETSLRHAVLHVAVYRAKVRGALPHRDVALQVGLKQQLEASEPERRRQSAGIDAARGVVEQRRIKGQLLREAIVHTEHAHRLFNGEAQVQETRLEAQAVAGPQ